MSFLDQAVLGDKIQGPGESLQTGMNQGVQAGIEVAKARQSWAIQNMDIQLKRQQLEQQKMEHVSGLFDKAAEAYKTDPALGDTLISGASKTAQLLQVDVDPEFLQSFKKSQPLRDWYQRQLDQLDPTTPDYLQKRSAVLSKGYVDPQTGQQMPGLSAVIGGQALQTAAEKAAQPYVENNKNTMMANAIAGKPMNEMKAKTTGGIVTSATKNMQAGYATPEDLKAVTEGYATPEQYAKVWQQGSEQNAKDASNTAAKSQAETEKAQVEAKLAPQREAEQERHNRAQESIERLRATLVRSEKANGIIKDVMTSTKQEQDSNRELEAAKNNLSDGATVNQVNLAAQAIERAVTNSARVAATTYNGIKLEDAYANIQKVLAKWRIGQPADAKVPSGILKNYQDITAAVEKANNSSIRSKSAQFVSGGVRNGLLKKEEGKAIMDNMTDPKSVNKFLDSIGYHEPTPASGPMKTPSAALLQGLSQKIPDVNARKSFLQQNGYDASGVK